uniref:UDP-N-acetylglucosamine diphosphorylase n=1 Tax=Theileria parva TaxID=5875 RepID=Q4N8I2_THEPA|eukprot:XP_766009.1 UDP-N-acetylglucosamine pyrophosphorylase [Theileria parva strain Muguga]
MMEDYRKYLREALNRRYEGKFQPFQKTTISSLTTSDPSNNEREVEPKRPKYNADKKVGGDGKSIHSGMTNGVNNNTGVYIEEYEMKSFKESGLKLIRNCEVSLVILAGGLSTRMGSCEPKSLIPVTVVKGKCLLQLHLEKVVTLFRSSGADPHPYIFILTCSFNYPQILTFLKKNSFFSLDSSRVVLLLQSNLPCFIGEDLAFSEYPKSCLSSPKSDFIDFSQRADFDNFYTRGFRMDVQFEGLVTSPNGNGDVFKSLHLSSEFMDILPKLKCLHVISVDNSLSKPLDPEFIGLQVHLPYFEMLNKCILRKDGESLGVFCVKDYPQIIEYTEINNVLQTYNGDLSNNSADTSVNQFVLGNMCDHLFSGKFITKVLEKKLYEEMPFHAAKKRIPYWCNETLKFLFPDKPNGYKLELFIFDIMQFTNNVMVQILHNYLLVLFRSYIYQ